MPLSFLNRGLGFMFHGSMVALVTPMHEDGSLDYAALRRLIDFHVEQGHRYALVVVGTTGESATLDMDEHCEVIRVSGRTRPRAPAGDCRHRRQCHPPRAIQADPLRRTRRCRCLPAGNAVLQQAHPGRPVPPFQGHRRGGPDSADTI